MPHMHLRGKAMQIAAYYPDGRNEILLDVPNYSFSWQTVYYLKKPMAIPKGTKIVVTALLRQLDKEQVQPGSESGSSIRRADLRRHDDRLDQLHRRQGALARRDGDQQRRSQVSDKLSHRL